MNVEQARVIGQALADLPPDIDRDIAMHAEARLVELAGDYDGKTLRVLGRRILDVVAPEVGEAHEARLLDREERDAQEARRLTMTNDGHGRTHGRFTIPTTDAAMLKQALLAIAAPKHQTVSGRSTAGRAERLPSAERLGRALVEYIERYPADRLLKAGGVSATVVVTMTLETLTGGLTSASLDTGERISPGGARRLACTAGIVPMVLDKTADHGTSDGPAGSTTSTSASHSACGTAAAPSRDVTPRPASVTLTTTPRGPRAGRPVSTNGRLLRPKRHRRAHDPRFTTARHPTGKVTFHRRT